MNRRVEIKGKAWHNGRPFKYTGAGFFHGFFQGGDGSLQEGFEEYVIAVVELDDGRVLNVTSDYVKFLDTELYYTKEIKIGDTRTSQEKGSTENKRCEGCLEKGCLEKGCPKSPGGYPDDPYNPNSPYYHNPDFS